MRCLATICELPAPVPAPRLHIPWCLWPGLLLGRARRSGVRMAACVPGIYASHLPAIAGPGVAGVPMSEIVQGMQRAVVGGAILLHCPGYSLLRLQSGPAHVPCTALQLMPKEQARPPGVTGVTPGMISGLYHTYQVVL